MSRPPDTLTPKEAAERIGVVDQTIYNWIAGGVFQSVTARGIGKKKKYFIPVDEVERIKREGNYAGNDVPQLVAA